MKYILVFITATLFISCNWFQKKTKDAANKTGEVVAKTGSEFANGVAKGIEKTFENEIIFSDELKKAGLRPGKIIIASSDSASDDILRAYLIFDNNFQKEITVKVFDPNGKRIWQGQNGCRSTKRRSKICRLCF
jgi:hypothetical protein